MTYNERITELENRILYLCAFIEGALPHVGPTCEAVMDAKKLVEKQGGNRRWEDDQLPAGIGEENETK